MNTIFDYARHFTTKEEWGDYSKMDGQLILILQAIREITGMSIILHCGYEKRATGFHPKGKAVDFHFISQTPFKEEILELERALKILQVENVVGLGIYTKWNSPGFHLDTRGTGARWGWIGEEYSNNRGHKYCSYEGAKLYATMKM